MSTPFPPGWYQDPTAQGDARYWNGVSWTQSVNRGGITVNVPIDPVQAQMQPVPGTQVSVAPPPTPTPRSGGSSTGPLVGVLIGLVVVVLVGILIYALVSSDDSDDSPTPGTIRPPATAGPAPTVPTTEGG